MELNWEQLSINKYLTDLYISVLIRSNCIEYLDIIYLKVSKEYSSQVTNMKLFMIWRPIE